MNPGEYEIMARVEEQHWWYRGLRDAVGRLARRSGAGPGCRVLDAGCGTGANLRFLGEVLRPDYLGGFDRAEEAVRLAREKAPGADVWCGDIRDPEIRGEPLDLIVSLDVIYIPGAERAFAGLQRLVGALRPGGVLILNLPAYDWLYSRHDVAVHTSERYTVGRVRRLLERLGLAPERLSYRLFLLFPMVVLARLPGMLGARPGDERARSDLHRMPAAWVNRLLFASLRMENRTIARGISLPWGSSVFALGRKT